MHGVTREVTRTVHPHWLNNQPSLAFTRASLLCSPSESSILRTLADCGEEGPIDRPTRAVTHTVGHNSVATFDESRESVFEPLGNVQPKNLLRGILAL